MSKKLITFLSILSLSLSLPLIPVNAAVKAGSSCKTLGITSVASGKTFKCIKSGKKLVWNKGSVRTSPTPTPIPTPILQPPVITISDLNQSQVNVNISIPKYEGIESDEINRIDKTYIAIQLSLNNLQKEFTGRVWDCARSPLFDSENRAVKTTPAIINCTYEKGNKFELGYIIRSSSGWTQRSPYVLINTGTG